MVSFTGMVLFSCAAWNAQTDEDWPDTRDKPVAVSGSIREAIEPLSYQNRVKHSFRIAGNVNTGPLSGFVEGNERLIPREPWEPQTPDTAFAVNQGQVRTGVRWRDRGEEIKASLGSRYDLSHARPPVQDLAVGLKRLLPEPLHPWYLKGEFRRDTEGMAQADVLLEASQIIHDGSKVTTGLGMVRRDSAGRSLPPSGNALHWGLQWHRNERIGLAISVQYLLDVHDIEALMSLEVKSRMPKP
jgi:hypothetical protein